MDAWQAMRNSAVVVFFFLSWRIVSVGAMSYVRTVGKRVRPATFFCMIDRSRPANKRSMPMRCHVLVVNRGGTLSAMPEVACVDAELGLSRWGYRSVAYYVIAAFNVSVAESLLLSNAFA